METLTVNNPRRVFIMLGRLGDIFNILPLVKLEYDKTGVRPLVQVAAEFKSALDGVSYAEPLIFHGPFQDVHRAIWEASKISTDIAVCQIYGNDLKVRPLTTSFVRESWIQAGAQVPWGSLPLVMDRRNPEREKALIERVVPSHYLSKKIILLALNGKSSPFVYGSRVSGYFRSFFTSGQFRVIDISDLKAESMVDLLALFDLAHCLVTVDTGILHLAHASKVPVVSLITSRPSYWHGSAWRPSHVSRFYYAEFPAAIERLAYAAISADVSSRKIIHTWADFRNELIDPDTSRRIKLACSTWNNEYATGYWRQVQVKQSEKIRTGLSVGDDYPVPFLRDVIQAGAELASRPEDIIAITNADVSFVPGLTGLVLDACRRFGSAFTHRWDFDRLDYPLINELEVKTGNWYPGSDAFFITLEWWKTFGHLLPDLLMGREKNDEVFRQLIKHTGGVEIPAAIYHEKHNSYWERPGIFENNLGNQYNRRLAKIWSSETGYEPDDWRWWAAIEGEWKFSHPGIK